MYFCRKDPKEYSTSFENIYKGETRIVKEKNRRELQGAVRQLTLKK